MIKVIARFEQTDTAQTMILQRLSKKNGWIDLCEEGLVRPDDEEFYHKSKAHRIILTDEQYPAKHHNIQ